jgi:hypothetical protein
VTSDGKNVKVPHIVATGVVKDDDGNELCTQNFVAAKLKVSYDS